MLPYSRVLVTGGTGFIGRHLVVELRRAGCAVTVLCRSESAAKGDPSVVTVLGDVRDPTAVARAMRDVEVVFHLAAWNGAQRPGDTVDELVQTNVDGTRQVLYAARAAEVKRLVHFSSVKVLGETTDGAAGQASLSPYGKSKREAEQLVGDAEALSPLVVCCLRLSPVWGPGHRGNLYRLLAAIDRGRVPPLPALRNKRSLVHVDDVVQVALRAASHPAAPGKTYTVTDGHAYSGTEIYESLASALGRRIPAWRVPLWALLAAARLGDLIAVTRYAWPFDSAALLKLVASAYYEDARLEEELGFKPMIDLERGLPSFVAWHRRESHG